MKRYVLALAALLALSVGEMTTAKAVEFNVGPGGIYVGHDRYRDYGRDRNYGSYNRYGGEYGGESCGYWAHACAHEYGSGTRLFEICMTRRAAVVACGR